MVDLMVTMRRAVYKQDSASCTLALYFVPELLLARTYQCSRTKIRYLRALSLIEIEPRSLTRSDPRRTSGDVVANSGECARGGGLVCISDVGGRCGDGWGNGSLNRNGSRRFNLCVQGRRSIIDNCELSTSSSKVGGSLAKVCVEQLRLNIECCISNIRERTCSSDSLVDSGIKPGMAEG